MMEGSCILKKVVEKSPPKWNCTEHQIRSAFISAAYTVCRIVDGIQDEAKRAITGKTLKRCFKEQYQWEHTFTDWLLELQEMFISNLDKSFDKIKEPIWIYPPEELNFWYVTEIMRHIFESIHYDYDMSDFKQRGFLIKPKATYSEVVKVKRLFV